MVESQEHSIRVNKTATGIKTLVFRLGHVALVSVIGCHLVSCQCSLRGFEKSVHVDGILEVVTKHNGLIARVRSGDAAARGCR